MIITELTVHKPARQPPSTNVFRVVRIAETQPTHTSGKFRKIIDNFQRFDELIPVDFVGDDCARMEVDEYTISEFITANAAAIVTHGLIITSTEPPTVWATGYESADYRVSTSGWIIPYCSKPAAQYWFDYTTDNTRWGYVNSMETSPDFLTIASQPDDTYYIQSFYTPDDDYVVEVREATADAHYRTVVPTRDAALALYDAWFDTQSRGDADWQQLTF